LGASLAAGPQLRRHLSDMRTVAIEAAPRMSARLVGVLLPLSADDGAVLEEIADVGDPVAVLILILADPLAVLVVHPHIRAVRTARLR
jgi:hypothetical protein